MKNLILIAAVATLTCTAAFAGEKQNAPGWSDGMFSVVITLPLWAEGRLITGLSQGMAVAQGLNSASLFSLQAWYLKRVIDLLALYKLNVLHLHLTDDQSWRLPVVRSAENSKSDVAFYSAEDLRGLVAYAEDRFVTIVPEVDTPGHASAFVRMRPELNTGIGVPSSMPLVNLNRAMSGRPHGPYTVKKRRPVHGRPYRCAFRFPRLNTRWQIFW